MKKLALAALLLLALAGCAQPKQEPAAPDPQNGASSQTVQLEDRSFVVCVRLYDKGISCDWERRWK